MRNYAWKNVQTCTTIIEQSALKSNKIVPYSPQHVSLPPAKDWASTSAVKAVLGLLPLCRSSARCSPSTFLHLPYKKLCRMSEVITSDSERLGHLNPDLTAKASAGSTEPMLHVKKKKRKPCNRSDKKEAEKTRRRRSGHPELLLSQCVLLLLQTVCA